MDDDHSPAAEFEALFRAVYLRFHRRDAKRSALSGASQAVLLHLARSGPLTVGEAARHFHRAQSVVSEIVEGLVRKGLLQRMRDPSDRRRTLVWLSDRGLQRLREDQRVLSHELLTAALERMPREARAGLLSGLRALAEGLESRHETHLPKRAMS